MPRKTTAAKQRYLIPARHAKAELVKKNQKIRVTNTHGTQVVDCWALNADNLNEFMSMEHCRVEWERYKPKTKDVLVTNQRRPILKIMEDTCEGAHDTLLAACDRYRYYESRLQGVS